MGQFLDPVLLVLLEQAPAYGYILLNRLQEFGLDFLAPTVIYRSLREMEAQGWVTSIQETEVTQGPPRRIYSLTPLGRNVLQCCLTQLRKVGQAIDYALVLHDELKGPNQGMPGISLTESLPARPIRIVIPSRGNDLDAPVCPVFGHCAAFIVVNPATLEFEALPNPTQGGGRGAGVQAVQTVLRREVSSIVAAHMGGNAWRLIQAAGIPVYRLEGTVVREVVQAFNQGCLPLLEAPEADVEVSMPQCSEEGK
jgi:predicted Fe-Mo cluster-binding NifX family protein/DNA-binding PadR family transcriptional regulator